MEHLGNILITSMTFFGDASGAVTAMRDYVSPTIKTLSALASLACVAFIINAGYLYMTSGGKPDQLEQAKRILKNAILGLVIVLGAVTLTSILTNAYGSPQGANGGTLPNLQAIPPAEASNGLVDMILKTITEFLNNIIQMAAAPFLGALDFFTKATPLMAQNPSVFNFWLAMVGITDVLFVIIVALLGFHVMSASTFGFDEIEFKHLLPRIGLIFLVMNTSIFLIDGIIGLSNALIVAVGKISGSSSVWTTLTEVVKQSGGQGLAALLMMTIFVILTVILLVYYVARLVGLFIGAVLSPLVAMVWLIPGFRDFAETAFKTYIVTIFTLFVHVVILQLSASLFTGMAVSSGNNLPDTLMAMVVGLATIVALLKTQGLMMQFSYVSMGARNTRMLGGQFVNGVQSIGGAGKKTLSQAGRAAKGIARKAGSGGRPTGGGTGSRSGGVASSGNGSSSRKSSYGMPRENLSYNSPRTDNLGVTTTRRPGNSSPTLSTSPTPRKTGTTYEASEPIPLKASQKKPLEKDKTT
jgi:hypothetical protein